MPGQKRYPSQLTTTRLGSHFKAATSEPPETSRPRKNKHPLQVKAVKQWAHMRTKQKPQQQHIVLHFILGIYGSVVFSVFCHLCVKYLEGRNQCNGPPNLDAPSCSSQGLNGQCQILHSWLQRSEKGNVFAIYLQVPWNRLLQQGFPNLFLWHLFQNLFTISKTYHRKTTTNWSRIRIPEISGIWSIRRPWGPSFTVCFCCLIWSARSPDAAAAEAWLAVNLEPFYSSENQ